jgi:hypothetical protein
MGVAADSVNGTEVGVESPTSTPRSLLLSCDIDLGKVLVSKIENACREVSSNAVGS